MSDIASSLAQVQDHLAAAAARAGRQPDEIVLVAISKTHPPERIAEAVSAGQLLFGESKVREARVKIPQLPGQTRWHGIGHLQKNKIRHALPLFELIHSVDSLELAREINRIATDLGAQPRVLLEVNVSGEGSKYGFSPEALESSVDELLQLSRLQIEGLMTIPPLAPEAESSRRHFARLRDLRDRLQNDFGIGLPELSMGMSNDYPIAVEEGATLVRVGSAIFGGR